MREILFRIKDRISEEWYYGFPLNEVSERGIVSFQGNGAQGRSYFNALADARTLGQYTGLTDKNGKKIFEGDVIKTLEEVDGIPKGSVGYVCADEDVYDYRVKFPSIRWDEETALRNYRYNGCEVLGNIFDNANLLKK